MIAVFISSKVFRRHGNSTTIDKHHLTVPVQARYIRFHPTDRHIWNCLRVEVYGTKCELNIDRIYVSKRAIVSIAFEYRVSKRDSQQTRSTKLKHT